MGGNAAGHGIGGEMAERNGPSFRLRKPEGRFYSRLEIAELKASGRYDELVREAEMRIQAKSKKTNTEAKPRGEEKKPPKKPCEGCNRRPADDDYSHDENGRLLTPRERVRRAQLRVLQKVENILDGNCESAKSGNYSCAKFVLDWSGVSDIRTPLAKPIRKKSVLQALLKKFREEDLGADEPAKSDE